MLIPGDRFAPPRIVSRSIFRIKTIWLCWIPRALTPGISCYREVAELALTGVEVEVYYEEMVMKIWLVTKFVHTDPDRKVYILGAHSSHEEALAHQKDVEDPSSHTTHVIAIDVDKKLPPILIGIAERDISKECEHNTPQD